MKTCNLATTNIRTFEVSVEQQVETEREIFAGIVDANVKV